MFYPTNHCHMSIIFNVVSRGVDVIYQDLIYSLKKDLTDSTFNIRMFEFEIFVF
jgi:hypothetical protein